MSRLNVPSVGLLSHEHMPQKQCVRLSVASTDNVLTDFSAEHVTNMRHKTALSTFHPGLDFQVLSISIDRSTLVLEKLRTSNPGGLGRLPGQKVKAVCARSPGLIREA